MLVTLTETGPFSEGCTGYRFERNHQYSTVEFIPAAGEIEDNGQPCLEIKSYRIEGIDTKQEIFTKRLCGTNIFQTVNPGAGSCSVKYFSTTNATLISVASALLGVSFLIVFFGSRKSKRIPASVVTFLIILLIFGLTLVAGFTIPLSMDIEQYDAFAVGVISVAQMGTVVAFLLSWTFCSAERETEQ